MRDTTLDAAAEGSRPTGCDWDDAGVREVVLTFLQQMGYRVIEANSGSDAIDVARWHEGTIDVLLTDVVMPRMSGREMAESLVERWHGIKVPYMSGYTDDETLRHGISGADATFIQKRSGRSPWR